MNQLTLHKRLLTILFIFLFADEYFYCQGTRTHLKGKMPHFLSLTLKLASAGGKEHLGKIPSKQGLENTPEQPVNDTNDYQMVSQGRNCLDFSEQRKASIVSLVRSRANGEVREVDSGHGGTVGVRWEWGFVTNQQTATSERNVHSRWPEDPALRGSAGILWELGKYPINSTVPASCNVCPWQTIV